MLFYVSGSFSRKGGRAEWWLFRVELNIEKGISLIEGKWSVLFNENNKKKSFTITPTQCRWQLWVAYFMDSITKELANRVGERASPTKGKTIGPLCVCALVFAVEMPLVSCGFRNCHFTQGNCKNNTFDFFVFYLHCLKTKYDYLLISRLFL